MNRSLLNDIQALLEKYPVLKNKKVDFSETGPVIEQSEGEIPLCKITENGPETMMGFSTKAEIRKSKIHGYGVFAKEAFEPDELIEESKLLKLEYRSRYSTDAVLKDYVWANQQCNCIECKVHGHFVYIGLGMVSQYNHADEPNTKQRLDFKKEVFTLKAKQRIEKGEEIFVTYGDRYFLIRNFWKNINQTKAFEKAIRDKNKNNAG